MSKLKKDKEALVSSINKIVDEFIKKNYEYYNKLEIKVLMNDWQGTRPKNNEIVECTTYVDITI